MWPLESRELRSLSAVNTCFAIVREWLMDGAIPLLRVINAKTREPGRFMGQQVRQLFIRGCAATLTAWLRWEQCRGLGGRGSACGGGGPQRGNAVANECWESLQGHQGGWMGTAGLFRPLFKGFPSLFFLSWNKFSHDSVAIPVWVILPLSGFTGLTRVW